VPTVPPSADFLTQHASVLVFLLTIVGCSCSSSSCGRCSARSVSARRRGRPTSAARTRWGTPGSSSTSASTCSPSSSSCSTWKRCSCCPGPWSSASWGHRLRRGARLHRHPGRRPGLRLAQGRPLLGAPRGQELREACRRASRRSRASSRTASATGSSSPRRPAHQLEPQEQHLVHAVRPCLLRDRDDGHGREPVRHERFGSCPAAHHARPTS